MKGGDIMKNSRIEELEKEIQLLREMFGRASSMFKRMAISGRIAALENELRAAGKES